MSFWLSNNMIVKLRLEQGFADLLPTLQYFIVIVYYAEVLLDY
jgi:hypothetical protein